MKSGVGLTSGYLYAVVECVQKNTAMYVGYVQNGGLCNAVYKFGRQIHCDTKRRENLAIREGKSGHIAVFSAGE
jgi:hypothetical protein